MATQADRLEALIADFEASIRGAFRDFIRVANSDVALARINELLEFGDIEGALQVVESYIRRFADNIALIQTEIGADAAAELTLIASTTPMAISFDPSYPRAAQLIAASRLALITQMTTVQREAVRESISQGFMSGAGTMDISRSFRAAIGLHTQQVRWAASYERRLRLLDAKALSMDLRDRRFDRSVLRAIQRGRPLTEDKIARMVERYRARALMYRADMIARTEAVRATSLARHEAMLQMIQQTGIDPRRIVRVWNATKDNRVRDYHADMEQQRVGINEAFTDGNGNALRWPGDPMAPANTTINCRCAVTYEVKPPLQDIRATRFPQ